MITSCEIVLLWMPQNVSNDKSTWVQLTAWCHQATSHYLRHGWPRSMLPYGVTMSQWATHWSLNKITEVPQFWRGHSQILVKSTVLGKFYRQDQCRANKNVQKYKKKGYSSTLKVCLIYANKVLIVLYILWQYGMTMFKTHLVKAVYMI